MKRFWCFLAALGLLSGCQGKNQNFGNPVVGPPPPRIHRAQDEAAGDDADQEIVQASARDDGSETATQAGPFHSPDSDGSSEPVPLNGPPGAVAARVNGTPIFVSEVLDPYAARLAQIRDEVSQDEFARLQVQLVGRDLSQYIETAVLVDAVTSTLEEAQMDAIDVQIDELFQEQLQGLMEQHEASTLDELDAALTAAGTTLENEMQASGSTLPELRKSFGKRALATQFLRESVGVIPQVTRGELLDEYRNQLDEYTQPARVQWQQVWIAYAAHGGRDRARSVLTQAQAELESGVPFDDVAARFSDGPMASRGGQWDWTQPESVSEPVLRDALARLAIGDVGDALEGDKAFVIARMTGRRDVQTTPFADVQNDLRQQITGRKRNEKLATVLKDIMSKAVIETMFDQLDEADDESERPNPLVSDRENH